MGLTRWLLTGDRDGVSRATLRDRLDHPWGWPASPALAARAAAHGLQPSAALEVGEALVVSVGAEGLWRLASGQRAANALELRGAAAASALLAQRLVTRDLPLYDDVARLHRGLAFRASPFAFRSAGPPPTALDGASYGLALSLAITSDLLRLPLPASLASTGVLQVDGSVAPVDGLRRKVELVLHEAPGIQQLLVPASQQEQAQEAAARALSDLELGPEEGWLTIVPVSTFQDAFDHAFPDADARLEERWREPAVAQRLANELYRMTLFDSPVVLGWSAIERCAEGLLVQDPSPRDQERLRWVHAIAKRHRGVKELPLPWPEEAELLREPRASRLRRLAQVVQSEAEVGKDPGAAADRARPWLRPPLERASDDAVLLGAMGRAYGAAERDEAAIAVLREAIEAWHDVGSAAESTHALCELLRQLGMAADRDGLRTVVEHHIPRVEADPRVSDKSLGFVRVALGRAYVQAGEAALGRDELSGVPDSRALPLIAEGARLRWLALAHDALGDFGEADAARRRLLQRSKAPYPWRLQTALAHLDAARRDGDDLARLLEEVVSVAELALARRRCPEGRDLAFHLTQRSRY